MASFGENLRRERELRGISLREIADATKISTRFLTALEEDRVELLPGGLFARSFVRQYAEYVGLEGEKLVAEFVYLHEAPRQGPPPPPPRRASWWPSAGAVFFSAVAVAAVVLALRRPAPEADVERLPGTAAPAPAVRPADRVYPSPAREPEPPESLVLTMTAQQSCWVEVRADGETVINRVLTAGETATLEAEGEIVLSVGNAGGLAIRVNDRPGVRLGKSGEVRRNIVITRQSLPSLVQEDTAAVRSPHSS